MRSSARLRWPLGSASNDSNLTHCTTPTTAIAGIRSSSPLSTPSLRASVPRYRTLGEPWDLPVLGLHASSTRHTDITRTWRIRLTHSRFLSGQGSAGASTEMTDDKPLALFPGPFSMHDPIPEGDHVGRNQTLCIHETLPTRTDADPDRLRQHPRQHETY